MRALIETVAVLVSFDSKLQKLIKKADFSEIDTLLTNSTFATRDAEMLKSHPHTKATNIITFIDKLERMIPGVRKHYDSLSERCHPNSFGHHQFFGKRDRDTHVVTYSDWDDLQKHFASVLAGAMLIEFVESCMDRLDKGNCSPHPCG